MVLLLNAAAKLVKVYIVESIGTVIDEQNRLGTQRQFLQMTGQTMAHL